MWAAIRRLSRRASPSLQVHDARLHSRQSGARRRRHGNPEDARRRLAALCALGAAAGAQGHRVPVPGARRVHREIFRDRPRSARARLRGRDARLARAGPVRTRAAQFAQGLCAQLRRLRRRSRHLHPRGGAAGLPAAVFRARAFDGSDRPAARRPSGPSLVRPHGAAGADDRAAGDAPRRWRPASTVKAMRLLGLGGMPMCRAATPR